MGMGKKKSQPAAVPAPAQAAAPPTVDTKEYADSQASKNAAANIASRAEENKSATLLQTKDDEELKKQQAGMGMA